MDRIRVVGSSGSGKTRTAARIAERLEIPHLDLDSVHWLADWQERDSDDFRRIVLDFAQQPRWVIDGNYNTRLGDRLDHLVDTYVWLDLPRWRVTVAAAGRTVRRALTREDLWGTGNRERLSSLIKTDPQENIVWWAWITYEKHRDRNAAAQRAGQHHWIRLRTRRQVNEFLNHL